MILWRGGFPPFKFGMTAAQVNALLDHPFGNVEPAGLPRASEYRTGEVRYFWAPISDLKQFRSFYDPVSSVSIRAWIMWFSCFTRIRL